MFKELMKTGGYWQNVEKSPIGMAGIVGEITGSVLTENRFSWRNTTEGSSGRQQCKAAGREIRSLFLKGGRL